MQRETVMLRPEVKRFAELMELRLRDHDNAKGPKGWARATPEVLIALFHEELGKHTSALLAHVRDEGFRKGSGEGGEVVSTSGVVIDQAADAANYLMMIVDVLGGLRG